MKRIAIGGIIHETHSFAEPPTVLADFEKQSLYFGDEVLDAMRGTCSGLGGMIDGAKKQDWQLFPTAYAAAMPGGIVSKSAYTTILQSFLEHLKQALPVDGVLLTLHGAMVSENSLDVESDILEAVRNVIGADIPIVVELDMHGNISPRTVDLADVLVAFDTNPHIDPYDRGLECDDILASLLDAKESVQPTAAYASLPFLLAPQATGTTDLPLKAVHQRAARMESEEDVICISVMAGFAYADTPFTGPSIIVTTNKQPKKARQYADELAALLKENQSSSSFDFLPPEEAVKKALAMANPNGPIILVDSADNIGGGTPGDGTDALKAMLALDVQNGTVVINDFEAVRICQTAGEGARVNVRLGGKTDQWHGEPVEVIGTVKALSNGSFECELPDNHFAAFYGNTIHMGLTACLQVDGVNVILTSHKTPPFDLGQLRHIGVIPEKQSMIAVKSAVAYRAAYMPITAGVVEMDTAGLCSANLSRFPYRHLKGKQLT